MSLATEIEKQRLCLQTHLLEHRRAGNVDVGRTIEGPAERETLGEVIGSRRNLLQLALFQGNFGSAPCDFSLANRDAVLHGIFHATLQVPFFRHLCLQAAGRCQDARKQIYNSSHVSKVNRPASGAGLFKVNKD